MLDFTSRLKHLRHLSVHLYPSSVDDAFIVALRHLPQLRALELTNASLHAVHGVASKCPQLEHLSMAFHSSETDNTLIPLMSRMTSLRSVRFATFSNKQSACLLAMVRAKCPLEHIQLDFGELKINDMCELLENCPTIRAIDAFCDFYGDALVDQVVGVLIEADSGRLIVGGEELPPVYVKHLWVPS